MVGRAVLRAAQAVFHWLVRCLMKDLACSRVAARSRSTKRVLLKDSPSQRPRIRASPAARSKTIFTTGLLLWAGQIVSQACKASVPVKESPVALSHPMVLFWLRADSPRPLPHVTHLPLQPPKRWPPARFNCPHLPLPNALLILYSFHDLTMALSRVANIFPA